MLTANKREVVVRMKIMIVDDAASIRFGTKAILNKLGYESFEAESCEKALDIHQTEKIDFFIIDWMMPGKMQGIDLVKHLRNPDQSDYCYIILLTSKNEKEDITEGITSGADDYIIKPFDYSEFGARVKMGVRNLLLKRKLISAEKEIIHLKQLNEKLTRQIIGINSTQTVMEKQGKIYNRESILKILSDERNNSKNISSTISIIFLHVKNLTEIKFIYNRDVFEEIIDDILKRINKLYPSADLIGWVSPDQMLIILPGLNNHHSKSVAYSIRDSLEEKPVALNNNLVVALKAEVGTATSTKYNPLTPEEMMKLAQSVI